MRGWPTVRWCWKAWRRTSIIAYGESLGTGIATRIAIERQVAGLILDAPYTSIVDVAAQAYPFLPVRLFLTDRYETTKYIANVKVPLLILHGERDGVVPVAMGRELARLANEPKRLVVFPEGRPQQSLHRRQQRARCGAAAGSRGLEAAERASAQ